MSRKIKDFYKTYAKSKEELIDNCNDLLEEGYELLGHTVEIGKVIEKEWFMATFVLYEK